MDREFALASFKGVLAHDCSCREVYIGGILSRSHVSIFLFVFWGVLISTDIIYCLTPSKDFLLSVQLAIFTLWLVVCLSLTRTSVWRIPCSQHSYFPCSLCHSQGWVWMYGYRSVRLPLAVQNSNAACVWQSCTALRKQLKRNKTSPALAAVSAPITWCETAVAD